jgi:Fe-S-cluster containining protein
MPDPQQGERATADIDLAVGSRRLRARISVPVLPAPASELLPIARAVTDAAVAAAGEDAAALGRPISCRAGCAACCRHLVPLTQTEARRLAELVEGMPEPRRGEVRARFAAARGRLEEGGRFADLLREGSWSDDESAPDLYEYFRLGIDCPFLEDETCMIYADRPLVCRGYVVISPPELCTDPRAGQVQVVRLPFENDPWRALAAAEPEPGRPARWVPLVLAPEWADAHPEPPPAVPGPELVRRLFTGLTGKTVPPAPPAPQETSCPHPG